MINEIEKWIKYVATPRVIENFAICPFASKAIREKTYSIAKLSDFKNIEDLISDLNVQKTDVFIIYFEKYLDFTVDEMAEKTLQLNRKFMPENKVILDNDPREPFFIGETKTTFDKCYLFLVQNLQELNSHSEILSNTSYYNFWSKKQMDEVVNWRKES